MNVALTCECCGEHFTLTKRQYQARKNEPKFCSVKCYHNHPNSMTGKFKAGHDTKMERNGCWKGGLRTDEKGYLRKSIGGKKYRYEHRIVMEEHLGRELTRDEVVHHKDGNRNNNEISNLELMSVSEHSKLHRKLGIL